MVMSNTPESTPETPDNQAEVESVDATAEQAEVANEEVTTDSLRQLLDDAEKKALRYQADMENFRRRTRRESQEQLKFASLPLVTDLLEVIDNLDRALQASQTDASASGLVDGVKMVSQQLSGVLEKHGCQKIESVGTPFDPNLHEALQMQPSSDYPSGTVMAEIRTGFNLNGRVVRPSQVFVSTGEVEVSDGPAQENE